MRVKGLVWLGIPADDYAGAVRFFTDTLGLGVAFDEVGTMELSAANDDRIQVFGPGHRYFRFCRDRGARIVPLFEVDDLDQARADLARGGAEVFGERGGVGQCRVDVAEAPAVADLQAGDLWPAFAGPGAQPLFQGRLGGVRVGGHDGYLLLAASAMRRRAGNWRGYGIKNACLCQAHTRLPCPATSRPC